MPTFLFLSHCCISLDNVASVDLKEKPTGLPYCDVWFCGGGTRRLEGDDYKRLIDYLNSHKAQ